MVAVRTGIMERSMGSLHGWMEMGAVVTTWESARWSARMTWSCGKGERTSTVIGLETTYSPNALCVGDEDCGLGLFSRR